jgi:hypothetical protein
VYYLFTATVLALRRSMPAPSPEINCVLDEWPRCLISLSTESHTEGRPVVSRYADLPIKCNTLTIRENIFFMFTLGGESICYPVCGFWLVFCFFLSCVLVTHREIWPSPHTTCVSPINRNALMTSSGATSLSGPLVFAIES